MAATKTIHLKCIRLDSERLEWSATLGAVIETGSRGDEVLRNLFRQHSGWAGSEVIYTDARGHPCNLGMAESLAAICL